MKADNVKGGQGTVWRVKKRRGAAGSQGTVYTPVLTLSHQSRGSPITWDTENDAWKGILSEARIWQHVSSGMG